MSIKNFILAIILSPSFVFAQIKVGAENYKEYESLIKGKNIGLVVNHTSYVYETHLLDFLIDKNNTISKIFAPEHGFRGQANAGEHINHSVDEKTSIPIISLYGKNKKPDKEQLNGIDLMIFDIQDVGVRFYTYISTMHYVMEACSENNIPLIILDRPNPNGHYVDGPVLDLKYKSFIGMHPIPIVHGLTVGELAIMINNEGWMKEGIKCDLKVIKCINYSHSAFYKLPIAPSPNLPNMKSIYLYPSLCLFEGTDVSVGRGTNKQFQIYGHPSFTNPEYNYHFTPISNAGSKYPKHQNIQCYGIDLSKSLISNLQKEGFNLKYFISAYQNFSLKDEFFLSNNFINKLSGNNEFKNQIINEIPIKSISESWEPKLSDYKTMRKKYLLYPDFE